MLSYQDKNTLEDSTSNMFNLKCLCEILYAVIYLPPEEIYETYIEINSNLQLYLQLSAP